MVNYRASDRKRCAISDVIFAVEAVMVRSSGLLMAPSATGELDVFEICERHFYR